MQARRNIPIIAYPGPACRRLRARIDRDREKRAQAVEAVVRRVCAGVRAKGDAALFSYAKRFDGMGLTARTVKVSPAYAARRAALAPAPLRRAINAAIRRIRAFHARQKPAAFSLTTGEGRLWQEVLPLARAGVYVPGGHTSYPSSVLMTVIPAQIAGVDEIALATPFKRGMDPGVAYACQRLGVREIYRMGGAQAIAAFAYGTKSVKPVDCIVGPGNAYVACAKKIVFGTVAIDSIAGPSEVIVLADGSADPRLVALDMLAQAEHGSGDESAWCVTENKKLASAVVTALEREIAASPVRPVLQKLPPHALAVFVAPDRAASIRFVNECAPEHLEIMTRAARADARRVRAAGAVFVGPHSPAALGDYFIGTNHVLPTGRAARYASPLGVETFVRRMSIARITAAGLRAAAPHVAAFARAERFVHHALSVEGR
jgi:histidinol dehydrogenase